MSQFDVCTDIDNWRKRKRRDEFFAKHGPALVEALKAAMKLIDSRSGHNDHSLVLPGD